jgi:hypothetical protein
MADGIPVIAIDHNPEEPLGFPIFIEEPVPRPGAQAGVITMDIEMDEDVPVTDPPTDEEPEPAPAPDTETKSKPEPDQPD